MEKVNQMIDVISNQLLAAGNSDVAVGEPLQLGPYRIIVLARTSVGLGAGGGEGEGVGAPHGHHRRPGKEGGGARVELELAVAGKGSGGGGGGGVKVRPVGVVAIGPEGVKVIPVPDKPGILDKLFEKIPDLVEKIQALIPDKKAGTKESC